MNSYNENLQASVVASLSTQEVDIKKVASERNASMFSLYYAQGARITSEEKLEAITIQYADQRSMQQAAVSDNNVAINLMDAANQGKTGTALSVNNIAVAAANVQVAANAILKLASNVGGISTIANAADFDTQIYTMANEAEFFIGNTAFEAEKASQYAMEASSLTAQVSISTVNDQAKAAGSGMQTLLDTLTNQFNVTADNMATQNAMLSASSDAEKKAEGLLEDINVNYFATREAYALTNEELNLNIIIPAKTPKGTEGPSSPYMTNTYYTVFFNPLESAFPPKRTVKPGYPVEEYCLFLVKYDQAPSFTISMAESLIQDEVKSTYVVVDAALADGQNRFEEKIFISELNDIQNKPLQLGVAYTIFVFAKLSESYKKSLNNFNDFLSAPSASFSILNQIQSPTPVDIKILPEPDGSKLDPPATPSKTESIEFTVLQDKAFNDDVEYRLYLLPDQTSLVQGLLTAAGLRDLEIEVERLEEIADTYDPQINAVTEEINSNEASLASVNQQIKETKEEIKATPADDKEKQDQLKANLKELEAEKISLTNELTLENQELTSLVNQKNELESKLDPNMQTAPGFFFNKTLAEHVPAGSYTKFTHLKSKAESKSEFLRVAGKLKFEPDMTDNFGNPLVSGTSYIAAILATVSIDNPNPQQFSSSLSDFENTPSFIYQS